MKTAYDIANIPVRISFDELQECLHEQIVANGFWAHALGNESIISEKLALIHSEISEALEEVRKPGWQANKRYYREDGKPEGIGPELADAMIRLFDLAEWLGISLIDEIVIKDEFNRTRPYKHSKLL